MKVRSAIIAEGCLLVVGYPIPQSKSVTIITRPSAFKPGSTARVIAFLSATRNPETLYNDVEKTRTRENEDMPAPASTGLR